LFRTLRHSLSADLMRYKAFVEMSEEDVETPEEEPGQQAEESRARRRTRGRHDEDAEQHESAEEEGEDEQEGEDEEEPAPAAGRPVRRRAAARPRQQTARTR
jgi:hypothetical protein